jgi:hypothetical protein
LPDLPPGEAWTDERIAGFKERFASAVNDPLRVLWPPVSPVLDRDEIRALLAHAGLVLKPGETLILRVKDWPPAQVRNYQAALSDATEYAGWPRVILVTGDEMGVAQAPEPGDG